MSTIPKHHLRGRPRGRATRPLDLAGCRRRGTTVAPVWCGSGSTSAGTTGLQRVPDARRRVGRRLVLRRRRDSPLMMTPRCGRGRRVGVRRDHVRRASARLLEAGRSASPTWTPTTSTRRSAFPTRCPGSAARPSCEREDKELALLCVRAYNDWMIDEWCAGDGRGPPHPGDDRSPVGRELAADEIRRCADKGSHAVAFSREPVPPRAPVGALGQVGPVLRGMPGDRDRASACTSARRRRCRAPPPTPRSSSSSALTFQNAMGSLIDYVFSGTLARFPELTIAYSEGQVGWMPYVIERMDKLWHERSDNSFGTNLPGARRPATSAAGYTAASSTTRPGSRTATASAWTVISFETDYPHADSTFPHTREGRDRDLHQRRPRTTTRPTSSCAATPSGRSAWNAGGSAPDRTAKSTWRLVRSRAWRPAARVVAVYKFFRSGPRLDGAIKRSVG